VPDEIRVIHYYYATMPISLARPLVSYRPYTKSVSTCLVSPRFHTVYADPNWI
jgi:hypothetical protein